MLFLAIVMSFSVIVAAGVVVYAAYPQRGRRLPVAPWLGDAMGRAVEALPTQREPADFYESARTGSAWH